MAGNGSAIQLAIGYVVASVLGVMLYGALFLRLLADRGILHELRRSRPEVPAREVLAFSIPLLTTDAVWLLLNTFPLIVLTVFGGLNDVAAFQVVKPIATLNLLVSSSFTVLFLPVASRMVARNDDQGLSDLYWRTAIWTAVMTFPIFIATFALADPLTEILFGQRYAASGTYLAIMSLGYYVNAALGFNATTLSAAGRVRAVVRSTASRPVISVVAGLLLIPPFGALGAAVSRLPDPARPERPAPARAPTTRSASRCSIVPRWRRTPSSASPLVCPVADRAGDTADVVDDRAGDRGDRSSSSPDPPLAADRRHLPGGRPLAGDARAPVRALTAIGPARQDPAHGSAAATARVERVLAAEVLEQLRQLARVRRAVVRVAVVHQDVGLARLGRRPGGSAGPTRRARRASRGSGSARPA